MTISIRREAKIFRNQLLELYNKGILGRKIRSLHNQITFPPQPYRPSKNLLITVRAYKLTNLDRVSYRAGLLLKKTINSEFLPLSISLLCSQSILVSVSLFTTTLISFLSLLSLILSLSLLYECLFIHIFYVYLHLFLSDLLFI